MAALYGTIWVSLALFAVGEWGRARRPAAPPGWARWVFTLGLALALAHTLVAFAVVHGWSHEHAVRATAAQTASVFGLAFGWGVYVNYVFFAAWAADAIWWRRRMPRYGGALEWTLRAFYLTMIVNGAVIFAAGWRRWLGAAIVGSLVVAWFAPLRRRSQSRPDAVTLRP